MSTTSYPRIAARLYDEPWQMLPSAYQETAATFEKVRSMPDSMAADDPVGPEGEDLFTGRALGLIHPQIEVSGHLALARVHGITGKGLSRLAMQCGGFDTGLFRQQLENVAEDPAIRTLVIDFNSPGGMAAGNALAAEAIRAVSAAGKNVIGYTSGMCCSAAYWLACACDELHAEPDAIVGSISTIFSGVDTSRQWAMQGKELKLFATGQFKATGIDGKAWTPEEEAMIWERIGKIDAEFKSFVSARRNLSADSMQGQWWYAKHAAPGLVNSTTFHTLSALLESAYAL